MKTLILLIGLLVPAAEVWSGTEGFNPCPPWSKDPRCWEVRLPDNCYAVEESCETVAELWTLGPGGSWFCTGKSGRIFHCSEPANSLGEGIVGKRVLVRTTYRPSDPRCGTKWGGPCRAAAIALSPSPARAARASVSPGAGG
jgi:hypothetical protein